MPKYRGFTLVELLVTISIISILSAVGLVVYTSVMKQGRDSKRQSDLRSIQSALEQYYADQFFYPAGANGPLGSPLTNKTGNPNSVSSAKTYLNVVPTDPISTARYLYFGIPAGCNNLVSTNMCTTYCLYATLENTLPGFTSAIGCASGTYNFAVYPP